MNRYIGEGMDKEKKKCWNKLKYVPKTPEQKAMDMERMRQEWYTMRHLRFEYNKK